MKKRGIFVILLLLLGCSAAIADDARVELGLQTWYSDYTLNLAGTNGVFSRHKFGSVLLAGPALLVSNGDLFASAEYLASTKDYRIHVLDASNDMYTDLDQHATTIAAGYRVTKDLALFVDYRNSVGQYTSTDYTYAPAAVYEGALRRYGFGAGVMARFPVTESLSLTGKASYERLQFRAPETFSTMVFRDYSGPSAEIGASYDFTRNVMAAIGYRYEQFASTWSDAGESLTVRETFQGMTAAITYRF